MPTKKCKNCNIEFKFEEGNRKYCSEQCRYDFKHKKKPKLLIKTCEMCGAIFKTTTAKTKFCSMKCNGFNISAKAKERRELNILLGEKICSRCGEIKQNSDFYKVKGRDGSPSWCKKCKLDQNKKYAKNPDVAAQKKAWRKKYNLKTKDLRKFSRMKSLYGLSFDEYMGMMDAQSGKCAICGTKLAGIRGINIDHCHETNKIRGLLCKNCNLGLGFFKDEINLLQKAIRYISNT